MEQKAVNMYTFVNDVFLLSLTSAVAMANQDLCGLLRLHDSADSDQNGLLKCN